MSRRQSRPPAWSGAAVVMLAAAAISLGAVAGAVHGVARVAYVMGAVLAGATQVAIQIRRDSVGREAVQTAEDIATETRRVTNHAMSNAFSPILRLAAAMLEATSEEESRQVRAQIVQAVVYASASAIGPDAGVRACFFDLEWSDGGPDRLVCHNSYAGRAEGPRSDFGVGSLAGDTAIQMVLDDGSTFCADTDTEPPAGWDHHPHEYRTFIAVSVHGSSRPLGMLTIDSLLPGDLVEDRDKPILLVLSRILAVGLSDEPIRRATSENDGLA